MSNEDITKKMTKKPRLWGLGGGFSQVKRVKEKSRPAGAADAKPLRRDCLAHPWQ